MAQKTGWQASFSPFMTNGFGGVFAAMGLTFIAFEGYEIIAQTSEEVEDPKKNVPRAVFLSLLIVIPIYLLVAARRDRRRHAPGRDVRHPIPRRGEGDRPSSPRRTSSSPAAAS